MEDLKQSLKGLGWYDFFYSTYVSTIRVSANYNFITIFINIVIIIFFSIGLILTTHIIIDKIKSNSK